MLIDKNTMQVELSDGVHLLLDKMPLLKSREILSFNTDIHEHYDGTETRYCLLDKPRHHMIYHNYEQSNKSYQFLEHLRQNLRQKFLIISHERYYHTTLGMNENGYWYTNDSKYSPLMMIKEFDQLERIFVLDGRKSYNFVHLEKPQKYHENHMVNIGVYGLYQAMLVNHAHIMLNARHTQFELQFNILNSYQYYPNYANSYYDDIAPVYERLLNSDFVEYQYQQHQIINDNGLNQFYHSHHQQHQETKNIRLIFRNNEEYIYFKRWLYYIKGKYRAFLLADFENELQNIRFENDFIIARKTYFQAQHLVVITELTNTRKIERLSVKNYHIDGDFIYIKSSYFYYSSGLIYRIYPAYWYRLDNDNIEFNFLGKNITETNLSVKKLKVL